MQILKNNIKERIIETATDEFYEKGYQGTSMRDIAFNAKISLSNIYNYYSSKEQLFNEVAQPMYEYIINLIKHSSDLSCERMSGDHKNLIKFVDDFTELLIEPTDRNRKLIIILTEKSACTKYENACSEFVDFLELHFIKVFAGADILSDEESDKSFIYHVIAFNFFSGFLKLIANYKNRKWFDANLKLFMKYHLSGIFALAK